MLPKTFYALGLILFCHTASLGKIHIASSIPDFASIAAAIGGEHVEVFAISKANANPHFMEILPSHMVKVSRADVYLEVGLGLDSWVDALINGSRRQGIQRVDCSQGISVLEKPTGSMDASHGDVHAEGNPHYWLNPANGLIVAETIAHALQRVDPNHTSQFAEGLSRFKSQLTERLAHWKLELAFMQGKGFVTYHSTWSYWANAFGCHVLGYLEPYPGIPPTAKHLQQLTENIRSRQALFLLIEPYYSDRDARFVADKAKLPILKFTPSCEGIGPVAYIQHFENMVKAMTSLSPR